jgi:hypothetical protein
MDLHKLPSDLLRNILSYVEYPETPSCKVMKEEHNIYNLDHNWIYTKQAGYFYVHNFMSFPDYYFDKRNDPYEYHSYQTALLYRKNIT